MEGPSSSNEEYSPGPSDRSRKSRKRRRPKRVPKPEAKCCGEIGCTRFCLGKIAKSVRKQLKLRVQTNLLNKPELAYKFVLQFMLGKEINNFGANSKHRKKVAWLYFVPAALPELTDDMNITCTEIETVEVCQIAFLEVFGINERFIRTARDDESKTLRGEEVKSRKRQFRTPRKKKFVLMKNEGSSQQEPQDKDQANQESLQNLKSMYNWENYEITDQTLQGLVSEGFTSLLSISSIREDDLKYLKRTTGITQGQVALLRQAVQNISSTTISTCRALVEAIQTQGSAMQDQDNTSIEVTFQAGEAVVETPGENQGPSTSGGMPAVLECREGSVSPEASTSGQVKVIPCSIMCDSPSSDSS